MRNTAAKLSQHLSISRMVVQKDDALLKADQALNGEKNVNRRKLGY